MSGLRLGFGYSVMVGAFAFGPWLPQSRVEASDGATTTTAVVERLELELAALRREVQEVRAELRSLELLNDVLEVSSAVAPGMVGAWCPFGKGA